VERRQIVGAVGRAVRRPVGRADHTHPSGDGQALIADLLARAGVAPLR